MRTGRSAAASAAASGSDKERFHKVDIFGPWPRSAAGENLAFNSGESSGTQDVAFQRRDQRPIRRINGWPVRVAGCSCRVAFVKLLGYIVIGNVPNGKRPCRPLTFVVVSEDQPCRRIDVFLPSGGDTPLPGKTSFR